MTDTSKRLASDGNTLFQLGFESLVPNDGKIYGLTKGDKGKSSVKLVEITGGSTTTITWKYPEMAMYLVDKDKYDAIDWNASQGQIPAALLMNDFSESVLVGINECELSFADNFASIIDGTEATSYVDINKNGSRIARLNITHVENSQEAIITFTELDGMLKNKNIASVVLGDGTATQMDTEVKGLGIMYSNMAFEAGIMLIYIRDNYQDDTPSKPL